ncbi:hypothetical protein [Ruminococcus flavefaciens]|uniref:PH domain-containing protein n=1 Tax=Ruminococcus flavefaciens TaxID=1265 RepID=A0A1K1PUH7_RUMFL|nr:hypothetical protein [Ruminococcus flavefaciens]SFW51263.1 hypothetical protein SAMN02910280_0140 [Ruminococcus flavefaciens]
MFGKKKEEDWEYISAEDYFDENEYGRIMTEEEKREKAIKANTDTEYLKNLFRPNLMFDEQLLCVIGGGKGKTEDPLESGKNQRKLIKNNYITIAIVIFIFALTLYVIFCNASSLIVEILLLLMFGFPAAVVIGVIVTVIESLNSDVNGVNYAITDKRIISDGYGQVKTLSLGDITSTSASITSGSKGKITVKANRYEGRSMLFILVISNVNEPFRVKHILDNAIENYKAGGMDYKKESSDGSKPEYVPQTRKKLHKDDVPLTMYDKKIRTPYNSRSSDDIND